MTSRGLTTLVAFLAASTACAQDVSPGEDIYLNNCAACHGVELDGRGGMTGVMLIKPKDLTILSRDNDGKFPLFQVIQRIDGRDPLVAHGSPMPVFGPFFEGKGMTIRDEDGVLVMTSQPIIDVIEWLERIQE